MPRGAMAARKVRLIRALLLQKNIYYHVDSDADEPVRKLVNALVDLGVVMVERRSKTNVRVFSTCESHIFEQRLQGNPKLLPLLARAKVIQSEFL